MGKTPTAEEFLIQKGIANPLGELWRLELSRDCYAKTEKDIQKAMIEFAKLHVEAALKAASEQAEVTNKPKFPGDVNWVVDMDSVLSSYPLKNIE